ncbi:MAG: phytanoyl-CoA dioxygenase family protein [Opitutaceae bacterium]|nr:phytanoyl-CoA dioxygenase family protein [Opitutaceae bacterium]
MSTITAGVPRLSPAEVAQIRREGYVLPPGPVLPEAKFRNLKAYFEKMLADLPPQVRPESMDVPHFLHPQLFEWVFADEVLDLVEPIIGPDIALFSTHFICKPQGNGKRVPWHEDSHYWSTMIAPMEVVTVWLAIDPSRRENGCMKVIPRTHNSGKQGFSDYEDVDPLNSVFRDEIIKAQRDDAKAVYIELEPNRCSLHDARLIHGSDPNTSSLRRCGYTMRFMSTRVKFNHEKVGQHHQIYLARGRDLGNNLYADPAHAYPEKMKSRAERGKNSH